ncbi:MAG TPA: hypothetical protein VK277_01370 [Acidimicrobiales bacterium]|nr:hypothetical protein [Acidimicrobiales bacterium]
MTAPGRPGDDPIEEAEEESFPASDAPSSWAGEDDDEEEPG